MWPALQQAMEEFSSTLDPLVNTTAIPEESVEIYVEGKVVEVVTDRFERDPKARLRCIEHYGANCHACGFNFAEHYGERASGYIQVHHKMPLAQRRGEYTVDPVMDLIPLCANCHVVVHLTDPPMDMEGLAAILQGTKGAN